MLGGIIAGCESDIANNLGQYGAHLGTAFQIVDNILDYDEIEAKIGKKLSDDLSEGNVTLPMIHALENGAEADVAAMKAAIEGSCQVDLDSIIKIFSIILSAVLVVSCGGGKEEEEFKFYALKESASQQLELTVEASGTVAAISSIAITSKAS